MVLDPPALEMTCPPRDPLYHFSEDPGIAAFHPRSVAVPAQRPAGQEWLNGPLVWAIDQAHQALYLFPRACPRIVIWPLANSTRREIRRIWKGSPARMIAYVEAAWMDRIKTASLWRYTLPPDTFIDLRDAGMWVSHHVIKPLDCARVTDLPERLARAGTELRVADDLSRLKPLLQSSLHVSGIRLRNAESWHG